ncbi:MAG: hypothetical protein HKN42_10260 [Granulosicoccus sp.]|nr:hypothetical protein [Granulosicoccus sp.]
MISRTQCISPATGTLLAIFSFFQPATAAESFPQIPQSQSQSQIQADTIAWLLQLSGMSAQIDALPSAVILSFERSLRFGALPGIFQNIDIPALSAALAEEFNSERLHASLVLQLDADLSGEDVRSLARFYQSESGQEVSEAEVRNSILTNADRFAHWYDDHGIRSLTPARSRVIDELERALQATEAAVDTLIGMQVALQVALTPALPPEQRLDAEQLIIAARSQRAQLTREYHGSSLETLAFVFQDSSVDTLQKFTAMLNTAAGQRYVRAVNLGLSRGMLDAANALGQSMTPIVAQRNGLGV